MPTTRKSSTSTGGNAKTRAKSKEVHTHTPPLRRSSRINPPSTHTLEDVHTHVSLPNEPKPHEKKKPKNIPSKTKKRKHESPRPSSVSSSYNEETTQPTHTQSPPELEQPTQSTHTPDQNILKEDTHTFPISGRTQHPYISRNTHTHSPLCDTPSTHNFPLSSPPQDTHTSLNFPMSSPISTHTPIFVPSPNTHINNGLDIPSFPDLKHTETTHYEHYESTSTCTPTKTQTNIYYTHTHTQKHTDNPTSPFSVQRSEQSILSPLRSPHTPPLYSFNSQKGFQRKYTHTPNYFDNTTTPLTHTRRISAAVCASLNRINQHTKQQELLEETLKSPVNPMEEQDILPSNTLKLPIGLFLRHLEKTYICLRSALDHCYRHNYTPSYRYVKPIVEKRNDRKEFTIKTLQHICWLAPFLIKIEPKLEPSNLSLSSKLNEDVDIFELDGGVFTSQRENTQKNFERLKKFRSVCVRWVALQHDAFLEDKNKSKDSIKLEERTTWDESFNPEQILPPPHMKIERLIPTTPYRNRSISPLLISPMSSRHTSPLRLDFSQDENLTPIRLRSNSNSPISSTHTPISIKRTPTRLLSSMLHTSSNLSENRSINTPRYIDEKTRERIRERAQKAEKASQLFHELRDVDRQYLVEIHFWHDVRWVFDRMVEDFVDSMKYPISKLSVLCEKYSTRYNRKIRYDQVKACINELVRIMPDIVSYLKAYVGNNEDVNVKFEKPPNLEVAHEKIYEQLKLAQDNYDLHTQNSEDLASPTKTPQKEGDCSNYPSATSTPIKGRSDY